MQIVKLLGASCVLATALFASENPFFGKWKLIPEKSTFSPGQEMTSLSMSFEPHGDKILRVASGTYANGKPVEEGGPEGSDFAWDGKEHTVHEENPKVAVACTPVKDGATHVTVRMNGKLTATMTAQVSPDGKTLIETSDNTDESGNRSKSVLVFEKQ